MTELDTKTIAGPSGEPPHERAGTGPIRVCLVVANHPAVFMGGAQYQAHLLAEELASRRGTAVTYLCRRFPREKPGSFAYDIESIGDPGRPPGELLFDARRLWRRLEAANPDVIYQRMKQSYTGVCALYARRAGIPLVFHCASDLDVTTRWLWELRPTRLLTDIPGSLLGTWGLAHASHVVVQTERQARLLGQHHGIAPAAVIRNFQPLPPELPSRSGSAVRVLWVANFKNVKQPEVFVRLAERFADRRDLEFLMIGSLGRQDRYAALARRAERLLNLRLLGPQPLESVAEWMSRADIVVNTSRHEGSPNTFIEGWAHGAVVVSLEVDVDGGLDRLGIGYRAGSLQRLCEIVDRLSRSAEERQATARRAFAYVHEHHSLDNARRLADLILGAALEARVARHGGRVAGHGSPCSARVTESQ